MARNLAYGELRIMSDRGGKFSIKRSEAGPDPNTYNRVWKRIGERWDTREEAVAALRAMLNAEPDAANGQPEPLPDIPEKCPEPPAIREILKAVVDRIGAFEAQLAALDDHVKQDIERIRVDDFGKLEEKVLKQLECLKEWQREAIINLTDGAEFPAEPGVRPLPRKLVVHAPGASRAAILVVPQEFTKADWDMLLLTIGHWADRFIAAAQAKEGTSDV